jgi:hypothetical protein
MEKPAAGDGAGFVFLEFCNQSEKRMMTSSCLTLRITMETLA